MCLNAHYETPTTIHDMNRTITEDEYAALIILRSTGVEAIEAALLAKEALDKGHGRIRRARKCLQLGAEELKRQEKTVTFRTAVQAALEARQDRRPRTLIDFRYFTKRLMRLCPGLAERRVRCIRPEECKYWLERAFSSLHQRRKARAILSGVFSTAIRRGWCDTNPISKVDSPRVEEKPVPILNPDDITRLTTTAERYGGGSCAAAVGMMLYAGIRPHEVARLTWNEVDLQGHAIYIRPQHSKTGGARRVTIHTPLLRILNGRRRDASTRICPPNWQQHWRKLRRAAGWNTPTHRWPQDTLRHTFASYHLSHFRSYAELQCEIGHRDAALLQTRYVDQRAVQAAEKFWQ